MALSRRKVVATLLENALSGSLLVAGRLPEGSCERSRQHANIDARASVCYCHTQKSKHGNAAMTTTVLSVRVNQEERALLEAASEQAHTSLSEFVRRKAIDAAEIELLERCIVTIPAKDWEAFEAWALQPAQEIPALKELASKAPTWRR
jgi:uncharacterized protein (DUF1778 family)